MVETVSGKRNLLVRESGERWTSGAMSGVYLDGVGVVLLASSAVLMVLPAFLEGASAPFSKLAGISIILIPL